MAKKKKKTPQRDKRTGKFLTRRQIAARKAARKGKRKTKRKRAAPKRRTRKGSTMPRKRKRRRRRRRSSGNRGGMTNKQKFEVCAASAALGYVEENTEFVKDLPLYKAADSGPNKGKAASPVKRHLAYGLGFHFLSKSLGGTGGKWLDRASTALLTVGCFEAGKSKFDIEGGAIMGDNPYDVIGIEEGDVDIDDDE